MKKRMAALLASLMALQLVACGGATGNATQSAKETTAETTTAAEAKDTEAASTNTDSTGDGAVTIRLSWWGGDSRHEKTLEAVDKFMEAYPDIKVECEYGAWNGWTEKISTSLVAGASADVMQTNWNWLYQFSSDGSKYADLNDYADVFNNFADYDKTTLDTCVVAGKQQAIPISTTGKVFYWNKTTFDKAGIAIPTTFDELIAAGETFKEKLGDDYYPLALFEYERYLLMVYYLESKYEKPWAVDNQCNYTVEEITDGLEWINSLEEHHVLPSIEYLKGQGVDTIEKNPDWACGKYAGFFEWDSAQKKFADGLQEGQEFVLGDYITGFGKKVAGMYKISQAWTIAESSQHKKEAALLINFLVSDPEAVKILGVERGVVVNKAAEKILEEDGQLNGLTYEGNKLAMANANYPLDPNFENSSLKDTTGSYYTTMESLSYGDDPAELAQNLLDDINSVYAENAY